MKRSCTSIVAVGIACATFLSFAQQPNGSIVITGKAAAALSPYKVMPTSLPTANLLNVEGEATAISNELNQVITELIAQKRYAKLDKTADNLRKSKAQTASGTWHLEIFYRILCYDGAGDDNLSEEMWKARLAFLKTWVSTMPTSITARVALARYYKSYAWKARGSGYANTVTEEGGRLFQNRLQQARQILIEARLLESKCPVWWDTMQVVALGEGWSLASYDKVFNEAIVFEPAYTHFYDNKVKYLLPRWFGQEGDWQKFAAQSADKIGGEAGDILYGRIGWWVHQQGFYGGFLRDAGYSWPRMKKGLEALIKQHPDSLTAASELAYLAYQSQDLTCAKPLFERIGTNVDKEIWHEDKSRFMRAKTWALSK